MSTDDGPRFRISFDPTYATMPSITMDGQDITDKVSDINISLTTDDYPNNAKVAITYAPEWVEVDVTAATFESGVDK